MFLFRFPMNPYQCWKAKLERTLFSMFQYCKITVWSILLWHYPWNSNQNFFSNLDKCHARPIAFALWRVILKHKTIVHYVPLSFSFFLVVFLLESEKQEKNQSGRDWRQRSKWSRSPSRGDRPRTNQDSFKSGARSMFRKYFLE